MKKKYIKPLVTFEFEELCDVGIPISSEEDVDDSRQAKLTNTEFNDEFVIDWDNQNTLNNSLEND